MIFGMVGSAMAYLEATAAIASTACYGMARL